MVICFVLECITGFFDILIVSVLSQRIVMGSSNFTLISFKVCSIHNNCVQHEAKVVYFASTMDNETNYCFLLCHDTNLLLRKNSPPLVFFLSSTFPTQSTFVYACRLKSLFLGYHRP